jgi:hypothetical protein
MLGYENFDGPHVWDNRETLLQHAQKGQTSHSPNPGALRRALSKQGRNSAADPCFTFHASRFTVPKSHARTLPADFFSILLELVERLIPEDSERFSCV